MNEYLFVDFGFPFITNVIFLQRKLKALLMNEYPFVDFGFPFITNVISLQRKLKALLMNEYPFVNLGFPLVSNEYLFVELGIAATYEANFCSK
jgi:hypothetical protein